MLKRIILISFGVIMLVSFCACSFASEREYYEDIAVTLQDKEGVLVIKEWSFLLGSGAEIYYEYKDGKTVHLGNISCGDDGYCPFKEGNYEITQNGNAVDISYHLSDLPKEDRTAWRKKSFTLPE